MKAIAKVRPGVGLELIDAPLPRIDSENNVLVKLKAASICGSDFHIYNWDDSLRPRLKPPFIVGHEGCGEVVETGAGVSRVEVGDFVSFESHIFCDACFLCDMGKKHLCQKVRLLGVDRDGVFAEYASVPEKILWKNDRGIPAEQATLLEPFGNAVYVSLEENLVTRDVLIIGGGPAGLVATRLAKLSGAQRVMVIEPREFRQTLAKRMGADYVFDPVREQNVCQNVLNLVSRKGGVDYVFEMSGSNAGIQLGLDLVRPAGTFIAFGVTKSTVDLDYSNKIIFKGITIKAFYGRKIFETWHKTAALIQSKQLDVSAMITHRVPFQNFQKAFDLLKDPQAPVGKIILNIE